MALQVWLPLTNGTLKQQGLKNIIPAGSFTSENTGKLGKCIKTNEAINLMYDGVRINTGDISFGGWFKINKTEIQSVLGNYSFNSTYPYATGQLIGNSSYRGIGLVWMTNNIATAGSFNTIYVFSHIRTAAGTYASTNNYTFTFDTWTHIFLTFNRSSLKLKLYINGTLFHETAVSSFTDAPNNNLYLSYDGVYGGNGPGRSIPLHVNDVRIYDHCLSPMEVKQLAQGLVLHYPLNRQNWGQDNFLKNTDFSSRYSQTTGWDTSVNGTTLASSWGGYNGGVQNPSTGYHAHLYLLNGEYVYRYVNENGRWLGISQSGLQGNLQANTTYTFSCEQYIPTDSNNYLHGGLYYYKTGATSANFHAGSFNGNGKTVKGKWGRFSYTFTTTADIDLSKNAAWYIYGYNGIGTVYLRKPKLEIGSIATPWGPNSTDTLYPTMEISSTIELDCSGFCNNGIKVGTFTYASDTPKYSVSTVFTGTQRIEAPWNPSGTTSFTVAGWFYHTGGTTYYAAKDTYNTYIDLEGGRYFVYNSSASPYVGNWTSTANIWQHIVLVHDASTTKLKLYVNGNFISEVATNGTIYNSDILDIGGRQGAAQYSGKMSDFRIYATALSASDVKSLYQNCATIDPDGTIRGQIRS